LAEITYGFISNSFFAKNFQGSKPYTTLTASKGNWHAKTDYGISFANDAACPNSPEWSAAVELLVIVSVIAIWCFENWS